MAMQTQADPMWQSQFEYMIHIKVLKENITSFPIIIFSLWFSKDEKIRFN